MIFTDKYRRSKMITWSITQSCNFQCEYCFHSGDGKPSKKNNIGQSVIEEAFKKLGKDWIILITGGEPFMKKNFVSICQSITENHSIAVNSNLSTKNVYEFADKLNPEKVLFINSALHLNERKKHDPGLEKFIAKIRYLQDKNFNVLVSYVAHPSILPRIKKDFNNLKLAGVNQIQVKSFRGSFENKAYPFSYSEEDRKLFSSLGLVYPELEILNDQHSYFGNKCAAGSRFFIMDELGNLTRCSALRRAYGNLFDGTAKFDKEFKPCPRKSCGCPYEGIRNVIPAKGATIPIYKEMLVEGFYQSQRLINDPKLILKLKDKIVEWKDKKTA